MSGGRGRVAKRHLPLAGRSALVTGGGSGIGLASARVLVSDGAWVTICGRTEARLQSAVADLAELAELAELGEPAEPAEAAEPASPAGSAPAGAAGPTGPAGASGAAGAPTGGAGAGWVTCDVVDEEQVVGAVARAAERTGSLDIVVAAAGGSEWMGPIVTTPLESWRRTVDLNVTGTFLPLKHSAPVMARGGGGSFVGVSSIAAPLTHRYLGAYGVGKAGIEALVRVAADELGPSGIRVNAVRPGLIDTEMVAGITAGGEVLDDYLAQMPLSRVGTTADVAAAVRYLAGPESEWVTGQILGVDGGHSLRRGPDYTPFAEPVHGADALRGLLPE